jgi:hypothetical protein
LDLPRLSAKLFLDPSSRLELELIGPVFHRWIQEHVVEGFLIDVADYRHVHQGPGVVLIGHEADYALDLAGGRPGLLYRRKREPAGEIRPKIERVLRGAFRGARALEAESSLGGRLRFGTDEVELSAAHRLSAPNDPRTFELLKPPIEAAARKLYQGLSVEIVPSSVDPRDCFAVRLRAPGAPNLETLAGRF